MKAAILYGAEDFRIEELESPELTPDQYRLNVKACGVCHSELHQWTTEVDGLEYPRFIGHEVSGEIIEKGSKTGKFNVGDRVAVWTEGKGYATELLIEEKFMYPVNDEIPLTDALAEPIGCTTNGVLKANIMLNDTVALVGTGFMGLIMIQELRLLGIRKIIAIDIRDDMLKLAENLGADVLINPKRDKVLQKVKESNEGKLVDVTFEVGGNEATLNLASSLTRMEGKLVMFGFHPGPRKINDLGFWNWMAFDIVNAHFRNQATILHGTAVGMDLLNQRKLNMKPLVTHKFALNEINEAFKTATGKPEGFVKAVIDMEK